MVCSWPYSPYINTAFSKRIAHTLINHSVGSYLIRRLRNKIDIGKFLLKQ